MRNINWEKVKNFKKVDSHLPKKKKHIKRFTAYIMCFGAAQKG